MSEYTEQQGWRCRREDLRDTGNSGDGHSLNEREEPSGSSFLLLGVTNLLPHENEVVITVLALGSSMDGPKLVMSSGVQAKEVSSGGSDGALWSARYT